MSSRAEAIRALPPVEQSDERTLAQCVEAALEKYFLHLEGQSPSDLYQMVLGEMEKPLLATVMRQAGGNQTKAADILGINRGTLRKKLKQYGLD
ncbi:DNA-binding transcriptional regulator Fis [Endothiovibrio diazotrophicus]